jgi:hypothetical protein
MICNARFHRGSAADRGVDANEVVPRYPERKAGFVIRKLAAVSGSPANVAPEMSSDGEVESFDMTCAYKTRLGASATDLWDSSRNMAHGAHPVRAGYVGRGIELHQLRVVNTRSEMRVYGIGIMAQAIARKLEYIFRSRPQITDKFPRAVSVPFSNMVRDDELSFRIERKPRPNAAPFCGRIGTKPFGVAADERMQFVGLHEMRTQGANPGIEHALAVFSGSQHQTEDRILVHSRQARDSADRHTFHHHGKRFCRTFRRDVVSAKFAVRFAERRTTGLAAPALNFALANKAEPFAVIVLAFPAGHLISPLALSGETSHNRFSRSRAWVTPRFGLAPPPVEAGSGAHYVGGNLRWYNGNIHRGALACEANLNRNGHRFSLSLTAPTSDPRWSGSYLVQKSSNLNSDYFGRTLRTDPSVSRFPAYGPVFADLTFLNQSLGYGNDRGLQVAITPRIESPAFQHPLDFTRGDLPVGLLENEANHVRKSKRFLFVKFFPGQLRQRGDRLSQGNKAKINLFQSCLFFTLFGMQGSQFNLRGFESGFIGIRCHLRSIAWSKIMSIKM